ncbi:MAG: DUF4291 domain-containing protein [Planctomycetota bacterium]
MKTSTRLPYRQIRARFDRDTVLVYQAYGAAIAKPALAKGRFVAPFSWRRMTWIKPSFLWLMGRSNWATKSGQENILGIRITRTGFERALSLGCLTMFDPDIHTREADWRHGFENASVHVQWDPERSLRGRKLPHRSLQLGLGSQIIEQFTEEWIVSIEDLTPLAKRIRSACLAGNERRAKSWLPPEKEYVASVETRRRLGISGG